MKKLLTSFMILLMPLTVYADTSSSTIVMDMDSGRILYSKNMNEQKLIASTTKIMTCIIVLENADVNKMIKVGNEILDMYGTNIYLKIGEEIKILDLLYGLMLRSGNDAAKTLAVNTFDSEEKFIMAMNEKAQKIGMKNTIFKNVHGLDDKTMNYSTAYDMALLARYAYKNKLFRKIISTKKYITKSSLKTYTWYNRVSLLNQYKYCVGGKNGYTPKAGKTLVSYAMKNDLRYIIVTLDDSNIYENHKELYERYFTKYKKYLIVDKNNFFQDNTLIKGDIYIKKSFFYPLTESEKDRITTVIELSNKNAKRIGKVVIRLDNKELGSIDIYSRKKKDISIFQKIKNLFIR